MIENKNSSTLPFRFGSEVYTWYMAGNGETHKGRLGHMIEIITKAGFIGIQPIFTWMGDLVDANSLANKLKEQGIELAALALALGPCTAIMASSGRSVTLTPKSMAW